MNGWEQLRWINPVPDQPPPPPPGSCDDPARLISVPELRHSGLGEKGLGGALLAGAGVCSMEKVSEPEGCAEQLRAARGVWAG